MSVNQEEVLSAHKAADPRSSEHPSNGELRTSEQAPRKDQFERSKSPSMRSSHPDPHHLALPNDRKKSCSMNADQAKDCEVSVRSNLSRNKAGDKQEGSRKSSYSFYQAEIDKIKTQQVDLNGGQSPINSSNLKKSSFYDQACEKMVVSDSNNGSAAGQHGLNVIEPESHLLQEFYKHHGKDVLEARAEKRLKKALAQVPKGMKVDMTRRQTRSSISEIKDKMKKIAEYERLYRKERAKKSTKPNTSQQPSNTENGPSQNLNGEQEMPRRKGRPPGKKNKKRGRKPKKDLEKLNVLDSPVNPKDSDIVVDINESKDDDELSSSKENSQDGSLLSKRDQSKADEESKSPVGAKRGRKATKNK